MKKILYIDGMMCEHCAAHVSNSLMALGAVKEAVASYEEGTAIVTIDGPVSDDALAGAVAEEGYEVTAINDYEF